MRVAFAGSPEAAVPRCARSSPAATTCGRVVTQPDKARGRSGRAVAHARRRGGRGARHPGAAAADDQRPRRGRGDRRLGRRGARWWSPSGRSCATWCSRAGPASTSTSRCCRPTAARLPVERAIMDGVTETGVTTMHMDAGLDTGPIARGPATSSRRGRGRRRAHWRASASSAGPLLAADARRPRGRAPAARAAAGGGRVARAQDHGRGPGPRPLAGPPSSSPGGSGRCRRTSARPPAIDGQPFKVWRARALPDAAAGADRRRRGPPAGGDAARDRWSCSSSSRRAGDGWRPASFLRGWRGPARAGAREPAAEAANGIARERSVALRVLRRVDEGAYADRALAAEARRAELDPRARAQAHPPGLRGRAAPPHARLAHRRRPRPARRPRARGARHPAPRRVRAGLLRRRARARRGRPGRAPGPRPARPQGAGSARAGVVNAVMRRIADEAPGDRLAELDAGRRRHRRACATRCPTGSRQRLIASLGEDDAIAVMAAAAAPAESALRWNPLRGPARRPRGRAAGRAGRATPRSPRPTSCRRRVRARGLAGMGARPGDRAEPGVAAGGARRRPAARRADPRPLRRPRRQDHPHGGAGRAAAPASPRSSCGPARAAALRALARRMGAVVEVVEGDAREVPLAGGFDAVLVDPPCTGLGVLSSRPDARWRRREESLGPLTRAPARRCSAARSPLVRPGGAGRLLHLHADRGGERGRGARGGRPARRPRRPSTRAWRTRGWPEALLTLPHRHGTDGFFIARMRGRVSAPPLAAGRRCCRP